MKHNTTLILASTLTVALSLPAIAHEHNTADIKQSWLGVFAGKYIGDSSRPNEQNLYDDGKLAGAEVGIRFSPQWAVRLEATRTYIDTLNGDIDGLNLGLDGMYFFDHNNHYVFAGIRQIDDSVESSLSGAIGLGSQWGGATDLRLITEAGFYRDFENDYNDLVVKLGVSYHFGQSVNRASVNTSRAPSNVLSNTPATQSIDENRHSDDDNDGVFNRNDSCPNTASGKTVDANGCAVKTLEEKQVRLTVLFDNNSALVKNPNSMDFAKVAEFLNTYPQAQALIEGHTSVVGSEAFNQALSEARAENVRKVLIDVHGAPADRIESIGYGESRPVNNAMTDAAHAQNRRVVSVIIAITEQE